jgi:hypothetical protein
VGPFPEASKKSVTEASTRFLLFDGGQAKGLSLLKIASCHHQNLFCLLLGVTGQFLLVTLAGTN